MATQMITNDVTQNRQLYIGGSDISAVMGANRWKTPFRLWCEKTGKLPQPDLSDNMAVRLGNALEQTVADLFTEETGKIVRRAPKVYIGEKPYMVAHIDRLIQGEADELLECKTCSVFRQDEWADGDIPQEYIYQVMWYLGITGKKTGYIAVLIGNQSFKYRHITFDSELFDLMKQSAEEFWNMVQNDTPPALMSADNETLKLLYKDVSENYIELYPDSQEKTNAMMLFEEAVARRQALSEEIKEAQNEKSLLEAQIKDVIKNNEGIKTAKYIVTWKLKKSAPTYDKEAMIADGCFKKYAVQNENKVINVKANKEFQVA